MATILNSDLTRESTVEYDSRNIQVTLTAGQKISFKLKGMKSGVVSIGIEDLYKQLIGSNIQQERVEEAPKVVEKVSGPTSYIHKEKIDNDLPLINLNDLRSLSAITPMPMESKVLFERIIVKAIDNVKKKNIK